MSDAEEEDGMDAGSNKGPLPSISELLQFTSGQAEEHLRSFLDKDEAHVLRRIACEERSFRQLAREERRDCGSLHRTYHRAITKYRIFAAKSLVYDLARKHGGCTVHPATLQSDGFRGFAVGRKTHREELLDCPTPQRISQFLWKHRARLYPSKQKRSMQRDTHIGMSSTNDGQWFLELTLIFADYAKANALAILEEQSCIHDFELQRDVPVVFPERRVV